MDEYIHKFHSMAFKHKIFIRKNELIYTRTAPLQDHLLKFFREKLLSCSFAKVFIHKIFQLYGTWLFAVIVIIRPYPKKILSKVNEHFCLCLIYYSILTCEC